MSMKKKRNRLYQTIDSEQNSDAVNESAILNESNSLTNSERSQEARDIVKKYAYYCSGVGALPVPFADVLTVNALQYTMIKKIAACYNIQFKEQRVKSLISSLLSGVVSASIIYGPVTNALTLISGLGILFRLGVSLSVSGSVTLALGKLFIDHFERGGTFLDLNISESRMLLKQEIA